MKTNLYKIVASTPPPNQTRNTFYVAANDSYSAQKKAESFSDVDIVISVESFLPINI